MTGLGSMDGNNNSKWSFLFFAFIFLIIYSSSCSSPQQSYKDKLPDSLKVISVYGERDFDKSKMRVDLQGWEADAPQSLFLAEPEKNKKLHLLLLPSILPNPVMINHLLFCFL